MDYRVQLLAAALLLLFTDVGVKASYALSSGCVNQFDEVNMPDSNCAESTCTSGCPGSGAGGGGGNIGPLLGITRPAFLRPQLLSSKLETRRDPAMVTLDDTPPVIMDLRFRRAPLDRKRTTSRCLLLYPSQRGLA